MAHKAKPNHFAHELAQELDDLKSLSLYESYVQNYPASFLRTILIEVLGVPAHMIRKSRAALFTYLVRKYGERANHHPRD